MRSSVTTGATSGLSCDAPYKYGQARARLYLKHPHRWRSLLTSDIIAVVYPAYLLSLPLARFRRLRWWPAVLLVPMVRTCHRQPVVTLTATWSARARNTTRTSTGRPARRPLGQPMTSSSRLTTPARTAPAS